MFGGYIVCTRVELDRVLLGGTDSSSGTVCILQGNGMTSLDHGGRHHHLCKPTGNQGTIPTQCERQCSPNKAQGDTKSKKKMNI